MTQKKLFTVSRVARTSRVSVRTLQYYDEIGLLVADRSPKNYRLYSEDHLLRLQQILIERSLGQSLEDIRRSLDDPAFDRIANLKVQREKMVDRLSETHRIIGSIDAVLENFSATQRKENDMDMKSIFDGFEPAKFEHEAKERWNETEAWSESANRTKRYREPEWQQIKAELAEIWKDAAAAMNSGKASDSVAALAIAERHRKHIDRWFYPLTRESHVNLANMWEADERFTLNIDQHGDGLTAWVASAVRAAVQ